MLCAAVYLALCGILYRIFIHSCIWYLTMRQKIALHRQICDCSHDTFFCRVFLSCQRRIKATMKISACCQTIFGYITVCFDRCSVQRSQLPKTFIFWNPCSGFFTNLKRSMCYAGSVDRLVFKMCSWLAWLACDEMPVWCPQRELHTAQQAWHTGTEFCIAQGESIFVMLMLSVLTVVTQTQERQMDLTD